MKLTNLKTTVLGIIGGSTVTTAIAALASPDVMTALQAAGVSPLTLIVIGGIAKIVRDYYSQDKITAK